MALALISCLVLISGAGLNAAEYVFPADAGVINVRHHPYNAKGDGIADDTDALQRAIIAALDAAPENSRYSHPPLVYLPNGTYRVTRRLENRLADRRWSDGYRAGMMLIGQSRGGTVIRLQNHASGFTNAATPRGVIRTGSENTHTTTGGGNQAFRHHIINLTIDIGSGNPGAVGIEFLASNRGAVESVTVRTSDPQRAGHTGIAMDRDWCGPALLKDVSIDGFRHGIRLTHWEYSMTMEHLTLTNQQISGLDLDSNQAFIRNLRSTQSGSVPALRITGAGFATLIDSTVTGGSGTAVLNGGRLLVRNVTTSGYTRVVHNTGGTTGDLVRQTRGTWTSHEAVDRFAPNIGSLQLLVEPTPTFTTTDLSQWTNALSHPGATLADRIAAACRSGKAIVYLPRGSYTIDRTIVISGPVRKLMGCHSALSRAAGFTGDLIRFTGEGADATILEHLRLDGPVRHDSYRTLAIRHCDIHTGATVSAVTNSPTATGKLFLENVITSRIHISGGLRLWARQLNVENCHPAVRNEGATAWILGLKTEGSVTGLHTTGTSGRSELLGGHFFNNVGRPDASRPAVLCEEAQTSASFAIIRDRAVVPVRERRGAITRTVTEFELPLTGNNQYCTLYRSGGGGDGLLREYWLGVGGSTIADIPLHLPPTGQDALVRLEGPTHWADFYASRIRGHLVAPTTGNYTFWLASDDHGELWLSTDATTANRRRIASVIGWTTRHDWHKYPSQKSAPVYLVAGQRYFVEILHKESAGGDTLAVAWSRPGQSTAAPSEIIPAPQLRPWTHGLAPDNFISNPGFEADGRPVLQAQGWRTWTAPGQEQAAFVEGQGGGGGPRTGFFKGCHWSTGPHQAYTYQTVRHLPNGTYQLRAWVRANVALPEASMVAKGFQSNGSGDRSVGIPVSTFYRQIVIDQIPVASGRLEVGFWSRSHGGAYIYFDDVEVIRVPAGNG